MEAGGAQNSQHQWWEASLQTFQLKKFLGRVTFGILPNINHGAPQGKYVGGVSSLGSWSY